MQIVHYWILWCEFEFKITIYFCVSDIIEGKLRSILRLFQCLETHFEVPHLAYVAIFMPVRITCVKNNLRLVLIVNSHSKYTLYRRGKRTERAAWRSSLFRFFYFGQLSDVSPSNPDNSHSACLLQCSSKVGHAKFLKASNLRLKMILGYPISNRKEHG